MKSIPIVRNAFFLFIIMGSSACNTQTETTSGNYSIDASIKKAVEKSIRHEGNMTLGQMDMQYFENDKEIHNTTKTGKQIPFLVSNQIHKDAISINAFAGMFAGFGFILDIKNDSCQVFFNIATDDPLIYKLNSTDSVYNTGVVVPTTFSKVVLSKKLNLKDTANFYPLYGYIELESKDFYEKSKGVDKKLRAFIKTYFLVEKDN